MKIKEKEYLDTLINSYKQELKSTLSQQLIIPSEYEDDFWKWFKSKARLYDNNSIRKRLPSIGIIMHSSFCFRNSYIVAKKKKHFFYTEGFVYSENEYKFIKHAFNVRNRKVYDYTFHINHIKFQRKIYVGVRISTHFARKIYKGRERYPSEQCSLLVSYFLHQQEIKQEQIDSSILQP